jgi:hypothetical protein
VPRVPLFGTRVLGSPFSSHSNCHPDRRDSGWPELTTFRFPSPEIDRNPTLASSLNSQKHGGCPGFRCSVPGSWGRLFLTGAHFSGKQLIRMWPILVGTISVQTRINAEAATPSS